MCDDDKGLRESDLPSRMNLDQMTLTEMLKVGKDKFPFPDAFLPSSVLELRLELCIHIGINFQLPFLCHDQRK